jgi:hypothetical protein
MPQRERNGCAICLTAKSKVYLNFLSIFRTFLGVADHQNELPVNKEDVPDSCILILSITNVKLSGTQLFIFFNLHCILQGCYDDIPDLFSNLFWIIQGS